ncbi:MAG: hypothetical protein BGO98_46060 [Myxococcales bacterium 68-20]|nr:hypothetical protein [Myxococcales bacterium]OJY31234.1 MAG: hypothetical protein BGO98_46060 [Myxococcales bacterium 68-20]
MSRVSSLVFGTVAVGIVASVMGCQVQASVTAKPKTRFVETNVVREDTADWDGSPIQIDIKGVGISLNGGVSVTADPNATKVKATARMLAMALAEEKESADASITEAKTTFTLSNSGSGITVACGHGGSHGSSNGGESGCEHVEIVVPAGSADKKLDLKVLSGNGTLTLQLSAATLGSLGANSNGGLTNADLPATQGATISLVSESDDISAKLPADFAADEVILQADADKIEVGPFTDIKNGAGAGGRGTAGTGLASLKLTAKEFAGSTGTITLR